MALDEGDIALLKSYGQGPYMKDIRSLEADLKQIQERITEKMGT